MRRWPARRIYYVREAVGAFNSGLIFTSIWTFYYDVMHLNLVQISLIFVVITITAFVLEIPTGVIADVYSRRLSVIIGGSLIGVCYFVSGIFPIYAIFLVCAFIEAVGDTCVSGALQAWITDEIGPEHVGGVFLRGAQLSAPMHWLGVALSIGLAAVFNYQVPIALGGAFWLILTLFLIAKMPETGFVPQRRDQSLSIRSHIEAAFQTTANGLWIISTSPILMRLFIARFFITSVSDIFYRFSRLHLLAGFVLPVISLPLLGVLKENVWFGMLEVFQSVFVFLGLTWLRRSANIEHIPTIVRILIFFQGAILVGIVLFAFTSNIVLALCGWLVVAVLNHLAEPLIATWLNQYIKPEARATVLSMESQVGVIGMLVLPTGMSVAGDRYGVRPVLALSSLFVFPVLFLYASSRRAIVNQAQSD